MANSAEKKPCPVCERDGPEPDCGYCGGKGKVSADERFYEKCSNCYDGKLLPGPDEPDCYVCGGSGVVPKQSPLVSSEDRLWVACGRCGGMERRCGLCGGSGVDEAGTKLVRDLSEHYSGDTLIDRLRRHLEGRGYSSDLAAEFIGRVKAPGVWH